MPTSGSVSKTLTVAASRASANGFTFRLHETEHGNTTFNNYKVQIIVTKVHSKTVTYGSTYGTLPTSTRDYYTFTGWYTAATGGTKIDSTSQVVITSNQTLYAQWSENGFGTPYWTPTNCGESIVIKQHL